MTNQVVELSPESIDKLAEAIAKKVYVPPSYPGWIHHRQWDYRIPYQPYYPIYCGSGSVTSHRDVKYTSYN